MGGEARDGVPLTNLDQPLFDGSGAGLRWVRGTGSAAPAQRLGDGPTPFAE